MMMTSGHIPHYMPHVHIETYLIRVSFRLFFRFFFITILFTSCCLLWIYWGGGYCTSSNFVAEMALNEHTEHALRNDTPNAPFAPHKQNMCTHCEQTRQAHATQQSPLKVFFSLSLCQFLYICINVGVDGNADAGNEWIHASAKSEYQRWKRRKKKWCWLHYKRSKTGRNDIFIQFLLLLSFFQYLSHSLSCCSP